MARICEAIALTGTVAMVETSAVTELGIISRGLSTVYKLQQTMLRTSGDKNIPKISATSFQTVSSMSIDSSASGLARWIAQKPHEESWCHLCPASRYTSPSVRCHGDSGFASSSTTQVPGCSNATK
ncbi:hypothetical protein B0T18DRAFT_416393 [Schizothecium vesticola]|uniref:Uncharacterized protein n=1 Tax=Schizothecium vesticola TaxID=314040 RepID=A0AA40ER83_9PEZI|nr:hypothetical protein B0T18DRAFT_416393 [Schizothecium vesticola]